MQPLDGAWAGDKPDRPVIVIPGILGTRLCERTDGTVVWGSRWSLGNFARLALPAHYDIETLPHVPCGLVRTVNILGPWQVHQYDDLIKTLVDMGYKEQQNLFVFEYDWRLSNRYSARRLDSFIRQKIPAGDVDIVAHSMGGIVAKLWMAELGGAHRVANMITLATPFLGSAAAFKTLDDGWGFWPNLAAHGLANVRETTMTFPSIYELLPSYDRCCGMQSRNAQQPDYFDPFDESVWRRFSWLPTEFRTPERRAWLSQTLADAKAISKVPVSPEPQIITVINSIIPTAWRVIFDPTDGHFVSYTQQPGDGTVYENSAANNRLPDARPALTGHQNIFADDAAHLVLRWTLTGGPEPTKQSTPTIQAHLITESGSSILIFRASAEVEPSVMQSGDVAHFIVELTGEASLASSDISSVRAFLNGTDALSSPQTTQIAAAGPDIATIRLSFTFAAPKDLGAFSMVVNLPGIARLTDNGLVVP